MTRALDLLPAELDVVRVMWSGADAGSLSDSDLIAVHERYCRMRRMLDAGQTALAAEIARRSRPELGSDGLAKTQGYRNPTALIAATGGTSTDWGRTKRLFTPTQRLALTERDGGCAMCGAPPGHTKVHHVRWWARDAGPTDLNNGVLLCESCHHRIHDNGWTIHIDGTGIRAKVWFIPPPHVDPARTPRLGGRARYDYAA